MTTTRISEQIIDDINEGKESAFSALYDWKSLMMFL